ncbi:unnamed protein product [Spirodela intermedia]|uniref:Agenet domain-containing protein n=1 Tax=Spirodela intermedia TaxID=51605 RepID=A0A7I8JH79_SPIIN|nr:unnamed protein product [Spirodela intermedia]CAA6668903.1 unnamed protein product [Spirodela intermedia]
MAREEERVFTNFSPSDAVEVSTDDDGFRGAWYEAKVLRPLRRAGSYAVVYDHLLAGGDENLRPLHEIVHASHVRPRPPLHSALLLVPHRPVDAWYNDGWWVGVGKKRRYNVCFPISREEMVFEEAHLRVHLEWVDNQWIDPELITSGSVAAEAYPLGFQVEVSHDSGASLCAWFVAAVEKHIWNNNLLVKYQKLAADGGEDRRREIVHLQHVRPHPPAPSSGEPGLLEEVEVLHECGWCAGVVSKILPGVKYSVKSEHWDGELEFHQDDVRLRQEWTNGRWVLPAKMPLLFLPSPLIHCYVYSQSLDQMAPSIDLQHSHPALKLLNPIQRDPAWYSV